MTIKSYEMGPGFFRLGAGGDVIQVQSQTLSAEIEITPNVTRRDRKKVLSGETKPGRRTVTYEQGVLKVTLLQDLEAAGIYEWAWTHAGQAHEFILVPNNALERGWSGTVYVDPLSGGGEVDGDDPESDISWEIVVEQDEDGAITTPIFGTYDPVDDEVTPDV